MNANSIDDAIDEALTLHRQVIEMGRPSDLQLNAFREWMERPTMGNVYLTGEDRRIWFETEREDLLTVWRPDSSYSVTSTLSNKIIYIYHSLIGARVHVSLALLTTYLFSHAF